MDDGSPDNCPAICDAWAAKDSRIRVIHKANGGLSDARNAGMAIAKAVSFPVGQLYEDEFWSWRVFALAKRVVTVEGSYYNYLQRDSGIMGMGFSAKSVSVIGAKTDRQKYIEEYRPGLTDIGRADIAYSCMHMGVQVLKSMGRKEASKSMKYLRGVVKQYPVSKAYLYSLPKKKGLHLMLIQKLFRLICLLHSV